MSLIEVSKANDGTDAKVSKKTHLADKRFGRGFVTVIKNAGKPNEEVIMRNGENLLVNAGIAYFHKLCYASPSATTYGATDVIALSTTSSTVSATTTWDNEITTAGLARNVGSSTSHNTSANATTLVKTFTATGTITAARSGLFNTTTAGATGEEYSHIKNFDSSVTLEDDDTLQVTWVLTLG